MARNYADIVGKTPYRPFSSYIPTEFIANKFNSKGGLIGSDLVVPNSYDPLNEDIDLVWAGKTDDTEKFNSYYDYYFTGEDIRVYIDGLFDTRDELDIASFAFLIRQEKQPLYGFWSYNYDVMMVGTRIISGEFSVYSRYPGRMRDLLSKAAEKRATFSTDNSKGRIESLLTGSEEDEKNIEKYWANSQLDRITSASMGDPLAANDRNIFSAHPPFNFIIKYGMQEGSVTTVGRNKGTGNDDNFDTLDRLMATDYNERLVQKTSSDAMNIVLQSVQLTNMGTNYAVGGQPLVESYQFLARDFYISDGSIRKTVQPSAQGATDQSASTQGTDSTKVVNGISEEELTLINQAHIQAKLGRLGRY